MSAGQDVYDERLWMKVANLTGAAGNSTALVGTPEQVAEAMLRYYDIGMSAVILKGFDPLADAIDFGKELIPLVREGAAKRDARRRRKALAAPQASDVGAPKFPDDVIGQDPHRHFTRAVLEQGVFQAGDDLHLETARSVPAAARCVPPRRVSHRASSVPAITSTSTPASTIPAILFAGVISTAIRLMIHQAELGRRLLIRFIREYPGIFPTQPFMPPLVCPARWSAGSPRVLACSYP